jgi:tetratricopeptide (TPR) repeat protein
MKNYQVSLIAQLFVGLFLFSPCLLINQFNTGFLGFSVVAEEAKQKDTRKRKKAPTLRKRVYEQLQRVQKAVDEKKNDEALQILAKLEKSKKQLSAYERAMIWNSFAYIYYNKSNITQSINYFNKVLTEKDIREQLELNTIFTLAQLNMQQEKYQQTLNLLDRWSKVKKEKLNDKGLLLQANAYYALKNYRKALTSIDLAIAEVRANDKQPKENWLVLKRALHYNLKQPKQVLEVCKELVRKHSKPKYWLELANMYGQLEQEDKQLAIMEAAYQQGYVSKKSDVKTLAQLYYYSGAPYKSAKVMSEFLEKGTLDKDVKTLKFLAQAWVSAKHHEKAIPVLEEAASISDDGNTHAELARVLVNLERWQEAIEVAGNAKKKGSLKNPGNLDIAVGMAYFNQKKFDLAISSFQKASQHDKVKKSASQWIQFVKTEKQKEEQMKSIDVALVD